MVQVMTNLTTRESARRERFEPVGNVTATNVQTAIQQVDAEITARIPLVRVITAAGDVNVGPLDGLIIMNKTTSENTTINLPTSASKIGSVKVVDFKGDSGSFPITVVPHGSELFNADQTSWPISGAGASATFDPIITGLGYAV